MGQLRDLSHHWEIVENERDTQEMETRFHIMKINQPRNKCQGSPYLLELYSLFDALPIAAAAAYNPPARRKRVSRSLEAFRALSVAVQFHPGVFP